VTRDEMPLLLVELFKLLPPAGSEWPRVERLRWMHTFEVVSRLIFKDDAVQPKEKAES
jgi:hypothetical protein